MKNFLREAAEMTSDAVQTAVGWALFMAVGYAVLFIEVGGRGTLWSQLESMWREGQPASSMTQNDGVRVIKLAPEIAPREDSMNYNYMGNVQGEQEALVAVNDQRPAAALTDVPADTGAKKEWRRSLKGELRQFAVYGDGSETTSAQAGVQTVSARPAAQAPVAASAVPESAYSQGVAAASRPAIASRARALAQNGSDSVRNFKK